MRGASFCFGFIHVVKYIGLNNGAPHFIRYDVIVIILSLMINSVIMYTSLDDGAKE